MAKITFIMAICNTRHQWIKRAVDSVINQTNPNWNLIIIDDGSLNDTAYYIDNLCGGNDKIKIHHQANSGLSASRNYGIDNAKTEYVAFLDADDWLSDEYVEKCLCFIRGNPDIQMLGIAHEDVYEETRITRKWQNIDSYLFSENEKKDMQLALLQESGALERQPVFFGAQWKFVYSLEFLNRYGIRNDVKVLKAQDSVFNLYAVEHASNIGYINEVLYYYFHNKESVTGGGFNDKIVEKLQIQVMACREFLIVTGKFDNQEFCEAWIKLGSLQFEIMLARYFCNKENKDGLLIKHKSMKKVLLSEPYNSLLKIHTSGLSIYRKLLLFLMRKKWIIGIEILYRIKRIICE